MINLISSAAFGAMSMSGLICMRVLDSGRSSLYQCPAMAISGIALQALRTVAYNNISEWKPFVLGAGFISSAAFCYGGYRLYCMKDRRYAYLAIAIGISIMGVAWYAGETISLYGSLGKGIKKACESTIKEGFGALPANVFNGDIQDLSVLRDGTCLLKLAAENDQLLNSNPVAWFHRFEGNNTFSAVNIYSSDFLGAPKSNCAEKILNQATEACKRVVADGFGGIPPMNLTHFFENISSAISSGSTALCRFKLSKKALELFNSRGTGWNHQFRQNLTKDCILEGLLSP